MTYRSDLIQVAAEAIAKVWSDDVLQNVLTEWTEGKSHPPRTMMDNVLEDPRMGNGHDRGT